MPRDYYEVLGVERSVSTQELKKSYRKLALQFHPDRNQGDAEAEERFKEISEAYSVLSDDEKRATYDRYGHAGLQGNGPGFGSVDDIFSHFGDIFGDIFGGRGGGFGGRRRDMPMRGADLRVALRLTLEEAAFGCQREIDVPFLAPCGGCEGTGAENGELETCGQCQGAGQVAFNRGAFMLSTTCPGCGGRGRLAKAVCPACGGQGEEQHERKVKVTIPAGIDDGQALRVAGQGQPGLRGGPPGHLLVRVDLEPHEHFNRDGFDLIHELHLSYPHAALGGEMSVPTLDPEADDVKVKVPAGVQPGDHLVVTGEGVPRLDGRGRGDLITVVQVDVPQKLSAAARELLLELQATFDAEQ